MVQSVELLLDELAEEQIQSEWALLTAAGLPSQGRHKGSSNRPHITLAVAGELGARHEVAVADVVRAGSPLPIGIGGAMVFGARTFVLARSVIPTVELLSFQERVVAAMGPAAALSAYQARGRWTPHVTLARRLTATEMTAALDLLTPIEVIDAVVSEVRRWDSDRRIDWLIS